MFVASERLSLKHTLTHPQPAHTVGREELCDLVQEVLEEVTGESWNKAAEQGNILQQCLQLQLVAVCARLLRGAVSPRLQGLAYQLLASAGSPHLQISSQALSTLSVISACTGAR